MQRHVLTHGKKRRRRDGYTSEGIDDEEEDGDEEEASDDENEYTNARIKANTTKKPKNDHLLVQLTGHNHARTTKAIKCTATGCIYTFGRNYDLKRHVAAMHSNDEVTVNGDDGLEVGDEDESNGNEELVKANQEFEEVDGFESVKVDGNDVYWDSEFEDDMQGVSHHLELEDQELRFGIAVI